MENMRLSFIDSDLLEVPFKADSTGNYDYYFFGA